MNPSSRTAEPFNFEKAQAANVEHIKTYIKLMMSPSSLENMDPELEQKIGMMPAEAMASCSTALSEIKRLYAVLDSLRRTHLPLAGEPGAPAVCTSCSMHGGQVPWPCEIYRVADKALPERMPA